MTRTEWLPDPASPWGIIHDHEFGYTVFARTHTDAPGGVEFGITEHVATDDEGPLYGTGTESMQRDPFTAPLVCSGWIKWDGCSHLTWGERAQGEPTNGYIHVCGADAWADLLTALAAARTYAAVKLPEFAGS
jgi:hypothetical protein